MTEPRPWEKPCPYELCDDGKVPSNATAFPVDIRWASCPYCHGTGVVPMTLEEMFDAAVNLGVDFVEIMLTTRVEARLFDPADERVGVGRGPTTVEALRAALEAVAG